MNTQNQLDTLATLNLTLVVSIHRITFLQHCLKKKE